MIDFSREQSIERFVLYSVLHPLLTDVPHHARKLEAERYLIDSGLDYTILQPSRYMQHLTPIWKTVLTTSVHSMPFSTAVRSPACRLHNRPTQIYGVKTLPKISYIFAGPTKYF